MIERVLSKLLKISPILRVIVALVASVPLYLKFYADALLGQLSPLADPIFYSSALSDLFAELVISFAVSLMILGGVVLFLRSPSQITYFFARPVLGRRRSRSIYKRALKRQTLVSTLLLIGLQFMVFSVRFIGSIAFVGLVFVCVMIALGVALGASASVYRGARGKGDKIDLFDGSLGKPFAIQVFAFVGIFLLILFLANSRATFVSNGQKILVRGVSGENKYVILGTTTDGFLLGSGADRSVEFIPYDKVDQVKVDKRRP